MPEQEIPEADLREAEAALSFKWPKFFNWFWCRRYLDAYINACKEIDVLKKVVANKAPNQFEWNMFCDDMNDAFEEDVRHYSDGVRKLKAEIATQAAEMEWYRSLKIVREEEGVAGIDGGEKAQMLHEMWEENVRLKAELEKRGISREKTEDIFGGKMMNTAQQGAELLARANEIATQAARIAELEKGLPGLRLTVPADGSNLHLTNEEVVLLNARIDALVGEGKSDE